MSKESTFHPNGGLNFSPSGNLIDQIKLASADYQPETLMSRADDRFNALHKYEDENLKSEEKSTMTPRMVNSES